jgi:hypothetical protein
MSMGADIAEASSDQNKHGRIAFLVVFVIVLLAGAYFTNQIYGNSLDGTASLIGELIGSWFILGAITWKWRRAGYTAAIVLAVAAVSVGARNAGKLQEVWDAKVALRAMGDPKQLDEAVSQNPENKTLKLFAMANKLGEGTATATTKLSNEIEPAALSKDTNYATASRSDLEALLRDLKTAETNATAFVPRQLALVTADREKIVAYASSLNLDKGTVSNFLVGLDNSRAKNTAFNSKMMVARSEFYRAYENLVAFLIGEFGSYKVATNGQLMFPKQPTADRYNVAANAMTAAAQRVNDLDVERKQLEQSLQDRRDQLARGK